MKRIVISVHNGLLAESISRIMGESGEFWIYRSVAGNRNNLMADCAIHRADILLAEVSFLKGLGLKDRLEEARQIRKAQPDCKIALLCDENTVPELAREVAQAKKNGQIDAFFYSSVTGSYLVAALAAL